MVLRREEEEHSLRPASHFDLNMSQRISQRLMFNGVALLFCLTLLLSPQAVVGADNAQNHIDPYEKALQYWQSKATFDTTIIKGKSAIVGDHPWQVALLNASIPDSLYAHFCGERRRVK